MVRERASAHESETDTACKYNRGGGKAIEGEAASGGGGKLPWYGDALGGTALRGDGLLELVQARRFLELFNETLNGLLAPFVLALGLLPAQQPLHDRRIKAGQH